MSRTVVDLSHPIVDGMTTFPGLPAPRITTYTSRADSGARMAEGVSFDIGRIEMVANTGTYLDAPFHFHADGVDIAGLSPDGLVDVPALVVDATNVTAVTADRLAGLALAGHAVLVHTGWSRHWGTRDYLEGSPFLTRDAVEALVSAGPALVGIDALNIDDVADLSRPAHHGLLGAGIPIVEHLTNLDRLPATGARLTVLPPPVVGMGTMPVRAVAVLQEEPHAQ